MLQYYFSLHQFLLIKWSFYIHSTTRNAPYVHPRLDLILELCRTFLMEAEGIIFGLSFPVLPYFMHAGVKALE